MPAFQDGKYTSQGTYVMLWKHRIPNFREFKDGCLEKRTLGLNIGGGRGGAREVERAFQAEEPAAPLNTCVASSGPIYCTAGKAIPNMHLAESEFNFHPGS